MTYIKEKIKWLNDHNIEYFRGECGSISINISDIPKELSDEYHKFSYELQKKYDMDTKPINIIELERQRLAWSKEKFPEATNLSSMYKLKEEAEEIIENIKSGKKDVMEYADVLMCLFDSAGRDGILPMDIFKAMEEKFEINKNRTWVKNPDNTYSHVKN